VGRGGHDVFRKRGRDGRTCRHGGTCFGSKFALGEEDVAVMEKVVSNARGRKREKGNEKKEETSCR